jgi:hypothetical protein
VARLEGRLDAPRHGVVRNRLVRFRRTEADVAGWREDEGRGGGHGHGKSEDTAQVGPRGGAFIPPPG